MKKQIIISLCMAAAMTLTACESEKIRHNSAPNYINQNSTSKESSSTSIESSVEEFSKTPIESLSGREKEIYEALIIAINNGSFYFPQDIRIVQLSGVEDYTYDIIRIKSSSLFDEFIYLIVSNSGDIKRGTVLKFSGAIPPLYEIDDVDIGNINRALNQYWEDLGLI